MSIFEKKLCKIRKLSSYTKIENFFCTNWYGCFKILNKINIEQYRTKEILDSITVEKYKTSWKMS